MKWFVDLFTGHGVAQAVVVYSLIIAIGVLLGRIKIFGISLGATWVLFVGMVAAHFKIVVNPEIVEFLREFGLIIFVYMVGLQVGPGFFASFKRQGVSSNLLAFGVVALGVIITLILWKTSGFHISEMVGTMSGAVTNTPGIATAGQAIRESVDHTTMALTDTTAINALKSSAATSASSMWAAYAVAYPFGVIGLIIAMLLLRSIFKVDLDTERKNYEESKLNNPSTPDVMHLNLENPVLFGKPITIFDSIVKEKFVVSRILHNGTIIIPNAGTILQRNDVLLVVASREDLPVIRQHIGSENTALDLRQRDAEIMSRRVFVTHDEVTRKSIGETSSLLNPDCRITRVQRAGVEFIADPNTVLNVGDSVILVGSEDAVNSLTKVIGNSIKKLDHPNLVPIFIGIALGVILGSLPIYIPGIPLPVKVGLAGGPIIVALLLSKFGNRVYLGSYTTQSANLMLREIGILLFLASVGLLSGPKFVANLEGNGITWLFMGMAITFIPVFVMGLVSKLVFKKTYFETCGIIAGASTDPPALAFAMQVSQNDAPSVAYASVYPLTMIMRIISAELLIVFLMS